MNNFRLRTSRILGVENFSLFVGVILLKFDSRSVIELCDSKIKTLESEAYSYIILPSTEPRETLEARMLGICEQVEELTMKYSTMLCENAHPQPVESEVQHCSSSHPILSTQLGRDQIEQLMCQYDELFETTHSDATASANALIVRRIVNVTCGQMTCDPIHCAKRSAHLKAFFANKPTKLPGRDELVQLSTLLQPTQLVYAWHCFFTALIGQAEHEVVHNADLGFSFACLTIQMEESLPDQLMIGLFLLACPGLGLCLDDSSSSSLSYLDLARSDVLQAEDDLSLLAHRWRGIARLFAGIAITRSNSLLINPALLWSILTGLVNRLGEDVDSLADVIHGILDMAGEFFLHIYRKLMVCLLFYIQARLKTVPQDAQHAGHVALGLTIDTTLSTGHFPRPYLCNNFSIIDITHNF